MGSSPTKKTTIVKRRMSYLENYEAVLTTFAFVMLISFVLMLVFPPVYILRDSDFMNPATGLPGTKGDGTKSLSNISYSDRGRLMIFVYSLVFGAVAGIACMLYCRMRK